MVKGVLVTAGAHGIGRQICLDFVEASYEVCFIDINEENGHKVEQLNDSLHFFHGDVSDKKILRDFVDFARERLASIDVLVNNAGLSKGGILNDASYEDLDYALAVGLKAPYELARLCKGDLIHNKGSIINISSSRAFQSEPNTETYSAVKGGVTALTHALATSLAPEVLVNAIAPGWINTEEDDRFITESDRQAIPAGRVGKPSDISSLVLFLANNPFMSGETIVVDGGMSKRMIYHGDNGWEYKA